MNSPQRPSLAGAAPRPDGVQIRLAANPAADWLARIDEGLDAYNQAHAPLHQVQPLVCVAQDPAGELLGDAVARQLQASGIQATPAALYPDYAPDYHATFFRDPDGIRLEISNYRQERRERHDGWHMNAPKTPQV